MLQIRIFLSLAAIFLSAAALSGCGGAEREISNFQSVRTLGTSNDQFGEPYGIATKDGEIFVSDGERGRISKFGSGGEFEDYAAGLDTPSGITFGQDGSLLVADSGRHGVYKFDTSLSLVAGGDRQSGYKDGEAADARFNAPTGIAAGPGGKIYVSDTYNDRVRVIENGNVSTLAGSTRGFADGDGTSAKFDTPLGLAMWGEKLLVADAGNRRIRVVEPDGRVWTLAGSGEDGLVDGFPLSASFVSPTAVTVSPQGAIYIADGNAIRAIGRRGFAFVETISNDRRGFRDGSPLTAQFNRPSGIAFDSDGRILVADSDNGLVRAFDVGPPSGTELIKPKEYTAEQFRTLQPARWPYDPPQAKRDIAGTLGEIRNELADDNSRVWFHNGLDIAGAYGETARFIRNEKVLDPISTDNFGTLRELVRLPMIGYIHIRLGRDASDRSYNDPRFIFSNGADGKMNGIRIPRGATFNAGEPIGTLNAMNHVHLIAGPSGSELNALAALTWPDVSDSISPTIEGTAVYDEAWNEIETPAGSSRIKLAGKTRIVVRAFDRMDGNPERRKLGVYKVGYQMFLPGGTPTGDINWSIVFDRNPPPDTVRIVYAKGSKSGPMGETVFNYIVTNRLNSSGIGEGFFSADLLDAGIYTLRVFAADFFGNQTYKDIQIEVIK